MTQKRKAPERPGAEMRKAMRDQYIHGDLSTVGKMLAMLWLNTGARTAAETDTVFLQHPEWGQA